MSNQHSRADLADLKSQITRKLGSERAHRYFNLLNKLLCLKLSKFEFDKLCFATIGRENIPLHNQFIRSILRNAHQSRTPPPKPEIPTVKKLISLNEASQIHSAWSNGDILPPSPRKSRSTNRRTKDRPSPLSSNGKINCIARPPLPPDESYINENGHMKKLPKIERSTKPPTIERTKAEEAEYMQYDRGSINAPLGIPFCPASVGGSRQLSPLFPCSSSAADEISNVVGSSEALRKRMEQIAEAQGLEGVSTDCADLLNKGLDAYLKRLIRSCVDLAGSRSGNYAAVFEQQVSMRSPNGLWQGNEERSERTVSLLDFRVAMELNPRQLGEDWPILLEKVCIRSFEE